MASNENTLPAGTTPAGANHHADETILKDVTINSPNGTLLSEKFDAEVEESPIAAVWKKPETPEHPQGAEIRRQVRHF
jgi:hypothetical protein